MARWRRWTLTNGQIDDGRNVASYEQRKAYAKEHKVFSEQEPAKVGMYPPNPLGLYDMITNGYEWVLDWYDPGYYAVSPDKNPAGPTSGAQKVARGYGGLSGDSLRTVSTTFMRHPSEPIRPRLVRGDGKVMADNPHGSYTARCVVNQPQRTSVAP